MTNPSQCRLTAWTEVRNGLPSRQAEVLSAIVHLGGKATMHDVARKLGVPLHTISGRFSELVRKKLIEAAGITEEGRKRTIYAIPPIAARSPSCMVGSDSRFQDRDHPALARLGDGGNV